MWTGSWPGSMSARGPRLARPVLLHWRLPAAYPKTPLRFEMPLDLPLKVPGIGVHASDLLGFANSIRCVCESRRRQPCPSAMTGNVRPIPLMPVTFGFDVHEFPLAEGEHIDEPCRTKVIDPHALGDR